MTRKELEEDYEMTDDELVERLAEYGIDVVLEGPDTEELQERRGRMYEELYLREADGAVVDVGDEPIGSFAKDDPELHEASKTKPS